MGWLKTHVCTHVNMEPATKELVVWPAMLDLLKFSVCGIAQHRFRGEAKKTVWHIKELQKVC